MENRYETNVAILDYLKDFMRDHPYMRFNQVLAAFHISPEKDFYEESSETLHHIMGFEFNVEREK